MFGSFKELLIISFLFSFFLFPLGDTNFTVNGDYVINKNVENEVASVGTGGVGISKGINDN